MNTISKITLELTQLAVPVTRDIIFFVFVWRRLLIVMLHYQVHRLIPFYTVAAHNLKTLKPSEQRVQGIARDGI